MRNWDFRPYIETARSGLFALYANEVCNREWRSVFLLCVGRQGAGTGAIGLVVGRLSLTTRDSIRRMTSFLERVPDASVLGVIANDVPEVDSYGSGYRYGYGCTLKTGNHASNS